MAIPESHSRVLEDGADALVEQDGQPKVEDGEEIVDLLAEKPATVEKPVAAAKPAEKPAEKPAAKVEAPAPAVADDEIPTEYRGKSPKELVKMLQHQHSLIGRQGSELGELRGKVDTAIKLSLQAAHRAVAPAKPAAPATPAKIEDSEFFAAPNDAVAKMVENHPVIQQIRQTLGAQQAEVVRQRALSSTQRFANAHPDAQQILDNPEFRQWVNASPVRRSLLKRAHQAFDFDAGDEVFSTWKALQGARKPADKPADAPAQEDVSAAAATLAKARAAKAAQTAAAQAAAVPSGASGAGKTAGAKKIYRRVQVLDLMENHPDKYAQMADEIQLAYAEGRVR